MRRQSNHRGKELDLLWRWIQTPYQNFLGLESVTTSYPKYGA